MGQRQVIAFVAPMPPSANRMYQAVLNRIIKSSTYRTWLNEFPDVVIKRNPFLLTLDKDFFSPSAEYEIQIVYYFERVISKRPSPTTVFLKLDLDNRVKALADGIKNLIRIDDANYARYVLERRVDPSDVRAEVTIRRME